MCDEKENIPHVTEPREVRGTTVHGVHIGIGRYVGIEEPEQHVYAGLSCIDLPWFSYAM